VTPSIEVIIKYGRFFLYLFKSNVILLKVKGNNKRKANDHRKKLSLKGLKS